MDGLQARVVKSFLHSFLQERLRVHDKEIGDLVSDIRHMYDIMDFTQDPLKKQVLEERIDKFEAEKEREECLAKDAGGQAVTNR